MDQEGSPPLERARNRAPSTTRMATRNRLRDENRSLRQLVFLGDALAACRTSDEAMTLTIDCLIEHDYQGVLLLHCDEDGNLSDERWVFHPNVDVSTEELNAQLSLKGVQVHHDAGENICIRALLANSVVAGQGSADLLPDLELEAGHLLDHLLDVDSVAAFPLWSDSRPVAVIGVWSSWPLDNDDFFFFQRLSRLLASHLDRARLNDLASGAEAAIEERERSRRTVQLLFEEIANPVLMVNPSDGRICAANPQAAYYLGYPVDAMDSLSFLDLKIGEGTDSAAQFIYRAQRDGVAQAQGAFRRADGGVSFGQIQAKIVQAEDNVLVPDGLDAVLLLSIRDTTERRAARSAVQRAYDKLSRYVEELEQKNFEVARERKRVEEAGRLKSQFLANMSHELRTPMNAIIGFSKRVLKTGAERLNTREQRNLNIVLRNAETLLEMINDLLEYSRLEANRMELRPEHFQVDELLEECVEITQQLVAEKAIEVKLECEHSITIEADRDKIRQILLNLLANSAKYTEAGTIKVLGHILPLDSPGDAQMVEFKVVDTGIGLRNDVLGVIFEAFRQVDGSHARKEGGTGLGLAICAKLADLLGGRLTVDSEFGKGSTFSFYCPLEPPRRARPEEGTGRLTRRKRASKNDP